MVSELTTQIPYINYFNKTYWSLLRNFTKFIVSYMGHTRLKHQTELFIFYKKLYIIFSHYNILLLNRISYPQCQKMYATDIT